MSTPFTVVGEPTAAACEGDSCLVALPVSRVGGAGTAATVDIEPSPAEAAAASARAVAAALDEGASL